jgi:cysteinyl-tRNA synthetase
MKEKYNESKKYSENIMSEVTKVLDDCNITYNVKSDGVEIVTTDNKQSKNSIEKTLFDNINIPKMVFVVLIDIVEIGDSVYIRQKTK